MHETHLNNSYHVTPYQQRSLKQSKISVLSTVAEDTFLITRTRKKQPHQISDKISVGTILQTLSERNELKLATGLVLPPSSSPLPVSVIPFQMALHFTTHRQALTTFTSQAPHHRKPTPNRNLPAPLTPIIIATLWPTHVTQTGQRSSTSRLIGRCCTTNHENP